ncbi:hypothetical protein SteCoe_24487 [Stentor coeruleus]|uniref:Uncharacterized protein n=1 Tax=Stentor coeruleus TaxID=5963 RepID=A0A1R2BHE9_9CILI|nr:hypothetical protein SteCoe_24487 [Stentor coeruleus]
MEAETDNFLKVLQNRQRNLTKKLDRIKKKQAEVKAGAREIKDEEKKMLESAPLVEELLKETEKLVQEYQKHLDSLDKDLKKPQPKPEDHRLSEIVQLWTLGEFFSHQQIKEKFLKENPGDKEHESFLLFHSKAKGQSGQTLNDILTDMEKSVDLYLTKSDKVAQGTLRTYKKLSEFANKGFSWSQNQNRPQTPVKTELSVEVGTVYSTQKTGEKKIEAEEVKVENKPEPVVEAPKIVEIEVKNPVIVEKVETKIVEEKSLGNKWADAEDEDEGDEKEENKEEKKQDGDEGFVEVTGRKKHTGQGGQKFEERGRGGRGRGRGRGRRPRDGPRNN